MEGKHTFKSIAEEAVELQARKSKDYGNTFERLFKKYGMPYALGHIEEKLTRVCSVIENGKAEVKTESVEDSLMDMACYCIMTLVELRNGRG